MSEKMQIYEGPLGPVVLVAAVGGLVGLWLFGVLGGIIVAVLAAIVTGVVSISRSGS